MKTKRQKHKAAKARSIAARAVKKLVTKAGSDSETNDVAQTVEPRGKNPKLERPSPPGNLVKRYPLPAKQKPDDRPTGSLRGSQTADAKVKLKSKLAREGKKRKEVTNCSAYPPVNHN